MSPGAELVTTMCAESTPEQRTRALEVTAQAMPHINEVFGEMDFFILSALVLGFITKGKIPGPDDWNRMADFLNGTETPTQN